MSDSNEE